VTDEQIREQIRERLRTGAIPRTMPPTSAGRAPETIVVNGGLGRPCAACDDVVAPSPNPSIVLIYSDRQIVFHGRCHVLWVRERGAGAPAGAMRRPDAGATG
jgi:hypothetical protein